MNKVCIVIPVYKENLIGWEKASFKQALKVLDKYDIVLYTYQGLDLSAYYKEASALNKSLKVEFFDKEYFISLKGYNRLCLTLDFYKRVSTYEYMLIYQLDAWVFRDELQDWCNKGYDYIGAPCPSAHDSKQWAVGNGGFSLRNIPFYIRLLSYEKPICICLDFKHGYKGFIKSVLRFFSLPRKTSQCIEYASERMNEDWLLSNFMSDVTRNKVFHPRLPSPIEAASFSLELSPMYFYEKLGRKLPFGCHKFEAHEYDTFWHEFISQKHLV